MVFILIILFFITFTFSLLEDKLKTRDKWIVYITIAIALILLSGFREIGSDSDSENYEHYYLNYNDKGLIIGMELSFRIIAQILNNFTNDVHALFLVYAILGVSLKFIAFKRMSNIFFLPVLVYMGHFYIMHEMTQIRAGVVSSLFLLALKPLAEGKRLQYFLLLCIAMFFHYSTICLIPFIFFNNSNLNKMWRALYIMVIPLGFAIYFANINLLVDIPIPYISDKIMLYQNAFERGIGGGEIINVFNAVFLMEIAIYLYIMFFYDTIIKENKYLPLLLKIYSCFIFIYLAFARILPEVDRRISGLYLTVSIILFTNIYYTIKPNIAGRIIVAIIGLSLLCINVFYNGLLK